MIGGIHTMRGIGVRVETKFDLKTGFIEQVTEPYGPDHNSDLRKDVVRRVLDTQDQQIRQALIELGWTPPINSQ